MPKENPAAALHVCLISEQPIPNLLPLLLEKPGVAIFLVTPEMMAQAKRLQRVVEPRGIRVELRQVPSAYDFEAIVQICTDIDQAAGPDADLALNVTGGTKIAALAAFQVFFFANRRRIFYLDTKNQQLLNLAPLPRTVALTGNRITVRDYLVSYGMNPLANGTPGPDAPPRPGLVALATLLSQDEGLLRRLNVALERQRGKSYANISLNELEPGADALAACLETCGMARRNGSGNLNIASEAALFFCQGGWLEEYVYWAIRRLGVKGLDLAMNLTVEWDGTGKGQQSTKNEFDVLFTHGNRLHLISCKTSDPERTTGTGTRATEALNELDTLADRAGGLFGQRLLVSARRLREVDRERAQKMGIRLLEGPALLGIAEMIRGWIGGGGA